MWAWTLITPSSEERVTSKNSDELRMPVRLELRVDENSFHLKVERLSVLPLYLLLLIQIANKFTNAVSSELEGFKGLNSLK